MKYYKVVEAIFIERPNRFIARVKIDGAEEVELVHVKNTGRCRELLLPGAEVILEDCIEKNPNRKTRYDLIAVKKNKKWVNIDSQAPNKVVKEWLMTQGYDCIKPEYTFGNSRMDFYMEKGKQKYLMEVKGCTLEIDGVGYFPDAPTERGVKHLRELAAACGQGYKCLIAFVIQMEGISEVRPNTETHPEFGAALHDAKAAGVEIIVAVNKIDKPNANIEKVKQELTEYELIAEDWGGSTTFVPVSAHTKQGIDELLDMILLTAEVNELKANPNRKARGIVIEAELDKGRGPVATILVQKGTLRVGDAVAAGSCYGKIRAMIDDTGRRVKEATPSMPVEILGLNDVPNAGEILMSFESDKEAKNFAGAFVTENKSRLLEETKGKLSLDNLFDQIQASDLKELPIIVKADVQGSVEAVKQSLTKLSNEEVIVKVIHGGVGAINESDVSLAATSNAIIIGFNVRPDTTAKQLAEQEGVDLRLYKVIYQAIEDVEAAMKGMLDPVFEEKVIGHAEVRQLFKASGVGTIAGSYILDGVFQRNCKVRISREGEQIFEGELASLKRFKDDVKEVKAGYECGLVFDGFNDVKEEDKVEAYIMVEVPR